MREFFILICLTVVISCGGDPVPTPKPRMYPKVEYPDRQYTSFDKDYCNLTFLYPDYAKIVQDTSFFEEETLDPCWFDVVFSDFNGRLHCSYYPIFRENDLDDLVSDAFTFVDKHDIKANYRQETMIENTHKASGLLFEIDGPVASPLQFFLTDSTDHFIRASLYFENRVNPDSMAPIHRFVVDDVKKIIETMAFN